MTSLTIAPLHPDFGAKITGIDLGAALTADQVEDVRAAIDRYSVLHFPDQELDDDRHLAFTKRLGEPEIEHLAWGRDRRVTYFGSIGNVTEDGEVRGNDHTMTKHATGNQMWHSDSSFREVPTFVSINYAYEVPDEGGETEFVSGRAAYKRLPPDVQARIDPLTVIHDYVFSRSKVAQVKASHAESLPPVPQKLVRVNPRTGEKNYYVGSHARSVVGWNENESRALIDDLMAQATRPEDIYSHHWRAKDLIIWDNRCVLHRGRPYDADRYRRRMRQTRVCGAGSSLHE